MSFLAPLFLIGGLAVALPVVFHLIRQTTRKRTAFSSLMFLRPTPPRLTRRSRLEHLLLLLLRCLVLCLLAAGFARPFLKNAATEDTPTGPARRVVVLVDTGASMRRAGVWAEARGKADKALGTMSAADQVVLCAFDRQLRTLVGFEQWNSTAVGNRAALARRSLAGIEPGWFSSHLDQALTRAAEMLADTDVAQVAGPRQIILITDLKEGSRLTGLQAYEWPKGVEVAVEQVGRRKTSNAGLELVGDVAESDRTPSAGVRVRVSNASDSKKDQFRVGWAVADGSPLPGSPLEVYVPAGQSRITTVPLPPAGAAPERIVLRGDDEDFDNTLFVIPPEPARSSILYIGGESEKDTRQPFYFLQRTFQSTRQRTVQVLLRPPSAVSLATEVAGADLIVVADALPDPVAAAVRARAEAGGTVLCVCRTAGMSFTLAHLVGQERLAVEEAPASTDAMLTEIDFRHPVFAPLADPRFNDFTRIHFWKYRRLDAAAIPGARVVAKFDTGNPALTEILQGKGRLLVLAASWHPADSQLALSTKFVPLLYSILELGACMPAPPSGYLVGDAIPLAADAASAGIAAVVQPPQGGPLSLTPGAATFSQTERPGVYRVGVGQAQHRFAVNLDPVESRTAPLSVDDLERLGVPIGLKAAEAVRGNQRKTHLQNVELEDRQRLWRWFTIAALGVLVVETWLAGRTARRFAVPGEAIL